MTRPLRYEPRPELRDRPRLRLDEVDPAGDDRSELESGERAGERAGRERPLDRGLQQRPDADAIAGRDEMERPAHERHADEPALDERLAEGLGVECAQARPEANIGVER